MDIANFRKYIQEEDFKITLSFNYINILNYTEIINIDEKEVIIKYKNRLIKILGNKLTIRKMLSDELLIIGDIYKISLGDK